MPTAAVPSILALGFLFGSTLLASRFSVGQYHPTNYVGLRLLIAGFAHVLVYIFSQKHKWPRDSNLWAHGALVGVLGTAVPMTAIVSSLQYLSSGLTSILLTMGPAFTVIFAHFGLQDERLTRQKVAGVILAFSGALLLAALGENGLPEVRANPIGYLLVFLAMTVSSLATVYIRHFLKSCDGFDLASIRMFFAAPAVIIFAGLVYGFDLSQVTMTGYAVLAYASLTGTFLGMILAVYVIQKYGATAAAMTSYVIPIIASVGGLLVLDEQITPGMLGGMGMILAGISVLNRKSRQEALPIQA